MWFGGWEETLCPVKAPANIVSLLQEKIVAENMAGKNWKKYMKAKRERPWVKKNLWKKRSCRYGKRKHLWGGDVISICIIYWSDIHVWAPGNYYIIFATKTKLSQKELFQAGFLWIWFFPSFYENFHFFVVRTFEKRQEDCFCLREHQNFTKKACTAYFHRNENKISPVILI